MLAKLAISLMIVLPDADEDRTIVSSFVWTKHRNVTDRRTVSLWLLQLLCNFHYVGTFCYQDVTVREIRGR